MQTVFHKPAVRPGVAAVLFIIGFAGLLAAVPVRTPELWKHLAAGRDLLTAAGPPSRNWLFDVSIFLTERLAGGWGLAAGKVAVVALTAGLMLRAAGGGLVAAGVVTLAVLACGTRLLLHPNTVSLLFLAALVGRLRAGGAWWPLALLTLLWANTDRWVWVGVGVAGLTWLGRALDRWREDGDPLRPLLRRAVQWTAGLAAVALLNPGHLFPAATADAGGGLSAASPFGLAYRTAFAGSPAGLAYFPLLVVGAGSFLLSPAGWRWERLLPWALLAGLSAAQARLVPAFAVLAGPVLAWNLRDLAARTGRSADGPGRLTRVGAGLAAGGLLAAAWPGWLLGPPYESRRVALDLPAAVEAAARSVAGRQAGGRTAHLSADTLHGFAWSGPADRGVLDPAGETDADRLVAFVPDPGRVTPAAAAAFADPDRWRLSHLEGGVAVFTRVGAAGPTLDVGRIGRDPSADERPAADPPPDPPADWTAAFARTRPAWPPDRGQAVALGLLGDAAARAAPADNLLAWEAAQAAGLAAGAVGPADLAVRLTLFRPPVPEDGPPPAVTRAVFALQQGFAAGRGAVPLGVGYAAVRAARRAAAADPLDPAAHHLLGEAYLRLLDGTRERAWARAVPGLAQLRRVQAVTALDRAAALAPRRTSTQALLGTLYLNAGYLDLALTHLRAAGGPTDELAGEVADRRRKLDTDAAGARVGERAQAAAGLGLAGLARDLLLGSDVAAFGRQGMELELTLLARTGRAADVAGWTSPEQRDALGPNAYHRLRADALAAGGRYAAADAELGGLVRGPVPAALWGRAVGLRAAADLLGYPLLQNAAWRALARSDFEATIDQLVRGDRDQASLLVLQGLLAVEAGDLPLARARLGAALPGGGPPADPVRRVAADALAWLDGQ